MNHPHRPAHKRRGFTIVELVIVIAVIGILAAVLVPTFGDVIQKANQAKDIQTAKNMNTALAVYSATMSEEPVGNALIQTIDDVMAALKQAGFDTEAELTPVCKGHSFYWYKTTGQIVYVNEQKNEFKLVYPKEIPSFPKIKDKGSFFSITSEAVRSSFAGKKISILGDSISTFAGVSNVNYTTKQPNGNPYYPKPQYDVLSPADTWWQQAIDLLGMELLVNNSCGGSCIFDNRTDIGVPGAYVDRWQQMDKGDGIAPDIIAVYLGTNDFNRKSTLGTADSISYDTLITKNADGTFAYTTPKTVCEAYAVLLHRMRQKYPNAETYCLTPLRFSGDRQPDAFNADLAQIAQKFGCHVIDLYPLLSASNFKSYMADGALHPNKAGMDLITQVFVNELLGQQSDLFALNWDLKNVTADKSQTLVMAGTAFTTTLTAEAGYCPASVTVTMGGQDITASCYSNSKISIPSVTGEITITAKAAHAFETTPTYLWEIQEQTLTSLGAESNTPTKLEGSISGSTFQNARYKLAKPVELIHDAKWVIEVRIKGTWPGMLFCSGENADTPSAAYLYHSTTGLLALGYRSNVPAHENYGITGTLFNDSSYHTYRLENRVDADGNNMVWASVDGGDAKPMTQYYQGSKSLGTDTWLAGKDLSFSYLGATRTNGDGLFKLNSLTLDYLAVWENAK